MEQGAPLKSVCRLRIRVHPRTKTAVKVAEAHVTDYVTALTTAVVCDHVSRTRGKG